MKSKNPIYEAGGVITEADGSAVTLRLRLPAGITTASALRNLCDITEQFGLSDIHLTTRQTVEIPHITPQILPELGDALADAGWLVGAERNEIVNITACPGTERCKLAVIDTISLANEIDKKYFGKEMPGKVRIAVSACPNSCVSETLNEIGITGICAPDRDEGYCTGCGTCVQYCREEALSVREGRVVMDKNLCLSCGTCVRACVFGTLGTAATGYRITLGGKRGRHPKVGQHLITVKTPEAALAVVDVIVDWIYRYASFEKMIVEQIGHELELPLLKAGLEKNISEDDIIVFGTLF